MQTSHTRDTGPNSAVQSESGGTDVQMSEDGASTSSSVQALQNEDWSTSVEGEGRVRGMIRTLFRRHVDPAPATADDVNEGSLPQENDR